MQCEHIDRVLGFFSSRPNWDPHPITRRRVCSLPLVQGGGAQLMGGKGVGGCPNSDEGTDTVVLKVYMQAGLQKSR
jgi:hypothetical protein